MPKFLHVADIHLDSPLRGLERYDGAPVDEIRHATRRALENLVRLAIDEAVDLILIAGDLYDGQWKDHRTGLHFVKQMATLREAGIPVVLIAGNHDAANKMTRTLRLPENVAMLSPERPQTVPFDELGIAVHGQSFARQAVDTDLSAAYPSPLPGMFNIGLLHTSATGREGHEPYAPCTLDGLRAREYDYWALGHVHTREVLCSDPPVIFPGNLQGRHIRETGPKGCTLVRLNSDRPELQPRRLDVFRWAHCRVDVAEAETDYDVLDAVRAELARHVAEADGLPLAARVEIAGSTPAHPQIAARPRHFTEEVRAAAIDTAAEGLWIEKVHLRTHMPVDLRQSQEADGPLGELVQLIAEWKAQPESLEPLLQKDLEELRKKLPTELVEGAEALNLDPATLADDALEQVQQMLVRQLLAKEADA